MGLSHTAKKENLLEMLVGGPCVNCGDHEFDIREFFEGNQLYTEVNCRKCSFEEVFQARRSDHLTNKHLF